MFTHPAWNPGWILSLFFDTMISMSVLIVVFMYGLWSSVFSLAKLALQYSSPLFLTGFRMTLAGLILLGYVWLRHRSTFNLKGKQLLSIGLLALFSIYLTNILEFWALQHLSAAKACFIYSLSPFFTAFFSYLHFGEKMNERKWIGLLLGCVGILPVLLQQTGGEDLFSAVGFLSWPSIAMIFAALCSVYGWVLLRLAVKDQSVSPVMANGFSMTLGGLMAFSHSFIVEDWGSLSLLTKGNALPFLGWTAVITFISNIICYNLYGMMLKKFTATVLSFFGLLSPIFASFHGWLFLEEPFSWVILLSTGLVSLGLWIVYATELKQGYMKKEIPVVNSPAEL